MEWAECTKIALSKKTITYGADTISALLHCILLSQICNKERENNLGFPERYLIKGLNRAASKFLSWVWAESILILIAARYYAKLPVCIVN